MAARATGNMPAAQQSFQDVLREQPNDLAAQRGLAEVASQQNDMNQLRQVAEAAIASHPDVADGYRWRGTVEANANQMDKASDDFQIALHKTPNDSATLLELGQVRLSQRRLPDAKTLLEQAVAKDGNVQALHLLALSDLQAKQPEKALRRIQDQIAISPQNSAVYDDLAMLQLNLKNAIGAAATAQKADATKSCRFGCCQALYPGRNCRGQRCSCPPNLAAMDRQPSARCAGLLDSWHAGGGKWRRWKSRGLL